jgi:hypothetical protein
MSLLSARIPTGLPACPTLVPAIDRTMGAEPPKLHWGSENDPGSVSHSSGDVELLWSARSCRHGSDQRVYTRLPLRLSESPAGTRALLLFLGAAAACHRPLAAPEATASSAVPSGPSSATLAPKPVVDAVADAAPAAFDPRPTALSRLVPSDDPDAGYAAPTGKVPDCEDKLQNAGVTFRPSVLPVHVQRGATCGAPQVVAYQRGPGNITYDPPPVLTCAMALAMASFERIVQEEANRTFQSPVVRVQQIGTYSCREIASVKGLASEHSYGNAIDLTRFTLASGKSITVLSDFDLGDGAPAHPAGQFLRAISVRAHREDVFSNVLTPFWNAAHKNHFHLDLARYRVNGVERREP